MRLLLLVLQWIGGRTLLMWLLLWVACASVVWQLSSLVQPFDATLMVSLLTSALGLGWLLARSRVSWRAASIVALVLCFTLIFVRVGQLWQPLLASGVALINLIGLRDWSGLREVWQTFFDLWNAVTILCMRVWTWLFAWAQEQPFFDPVASAIVWGVTLWLMGAWAAWAVRRRMNALEAFAPMTILLLVNTYEARVYPTALLVVFGVWLLLMAWLAHLAREQDWRRERIDFSEDIRFDLAFTVVLLTMLFVTLTALLPSISLQDFARLWQRWAGPLPSAPAPIVGWFGAGSAVTSPSPFERMKIAGLPRSHLIGSGPELSEQIVMTIKTDDIITQTAPRYYWRGLTYERYIGQGWATSEVLEFSYAAGEALYKEALPFHRLVQQAVSGVGEAGGVVYVAGQLAVVHEPYRVARRAEGDFFGALVDTASYRAESFVPAVGATQLRAQRATTSQYPDWIRARYLALPSDVPARVVSLARDLTATAPTPYDRARAIESYVRAYSYTLALPTPPTNRDVVDYFLFDLKQGYCDYYATAMVVLARAAGLPARLVVGYTNGRYDALNRHYVVTAADAHTWVEIYFSDVGWIEFEPTGGRAELLRPNEVTLPEARAPTNAPTPSNTGRAWDVSDFIYVTLTVLSLAFVGAGAWTLSESRRLRRMSPTLAVRAIYQRLYTQGVRLRVPLREGDTPYEIATALLQHVAPMLRADVNARVAREVSWLIAVYVRASFSTHQTHADEQRQAIACWRWLRWRLWWVWAKQKAPYTAFSAHRR